MPNRWHLAGLVALFLTVALSGPTLAQEAESEKTPAIKKVVLYKHGVGYFERWAKVSGDSELTLRFPEDQMKDVLKTLFAVDLDGGRIESINYDSKEPLSKRLQSIRIDLPTDHALSKFLGSLKGAPVRFEYGGEQIQGRIMGTEPYKRVVDGEMESRPRLVLLQENGAIKAVDLFEARKLELLDESLKSDLDRLLDILLRTKQLDLKEVNVRATGDANDRRVRIGYLVEAPIWKTSYRLISGIDEEPLLMAWAIVENPTEEDWQDVDMTFVSGNPLSFVLDLYTSFYPKRPVMNVAAIAARPSQAPAARERLGEMNDYLRKLSAGEADGRASFDAGDFAKSTAIAAKAAVVGEMFAYEATEPITIPAGRAAMVPILMEPLEGTQDVLLYRRSFSDRPAHAIWIKNTTGHTLETGPITFFEEDTAQGEGMLGRILKPGMEEIIPYALEPGVVVEPMVDGKQQPVHRVHFANGIMYLYYGYVRTTKYRLDNQTQQDRLLVLDHKSAPGFSLVEPEESDKRLVGHDRFRQELEAQSETSFVVRERREQTRSVRIMRTSPNDLAVYLDEPYLNEKAKKFLKSVIDDLEKLADLGRSQQALEKQRSSQEELQSRLRENVKILNDSAEERQMRSRFLKDLEAAEKELTRIREQLLRLRQQEAALQKALAKRINQFND